MTIFEFETQYATEWVDQYGTKLLFMPLSKGKNTGAMYTTPVEHPMLGGEYFLRQDGHSLYLGWRDSEYLFSPTNQGFELLLGSSVAYSFTRPV